MSPVAAPIAPASDPREVAFCAPNTPEVFHSVATPTEIWASDPFDVPTIHAEARERFEQLLHRASRLPAPPSGSALLLFGEAGSGKTHLMRAIRTRAHSQGLGYCGYMQMTTEVSSYPRYMLQNLIDGLEQPYSPDGGRTGMARLSAALLEMVPDLTSEERDRLCDGSDDAARLVDDLADRLAGRDRFWGCDLELLRVMLHLRRDDPRVKNRALMWLRCQDMTDRDRAWIGGQVPRTDEADPIRMLAGLARLMDAAQGVPLVLLIDQLEDMANLSAPVERFRKVVDAVTTITDQVSTIVAVIACLEDYWYANRGSLLHAKTDRLERDPEPIRLTGLRTADEIRAIVGKRLEHLYDEQGVDIVAANELFPFRAAHLVPLTNLRTRDILDYLRRHHLRCIQAGRWVEPDTPANTRGESQPIGKISPPQSFDLDQLWNDFHASHQAIVSDEEEKLAEVLVEAIQACGAELPDGVHFGEPSRNGRFIEVETHMPGNTVEKLLVAVCNRRAQGGGLGRQVAEVESRAGDIPVALVRTTDFPATKGSQIVSQIARVLKRDGRRVVAENADWRRMLAFAAFREHQGQQPNFADWQKTARPLGELKSLQEILRLKQLAAAASKAATSLVTPPPPPSVPVMPAVPQHTDNLTLGQSAGIVSMPVHLKPVELTQHAAFLGGSGSGKTTAALNLIEQLLLQGVPVVLLDRKGDLCRYADPAAWQRPLASSDRLGVWDRLRQMVDVTVYTPGESRGRPLTLPVVPAGFDQLPEADREQYAQYAAAALGAMMGFKTSDADKGQLAILTKAIEVLAAVPGATITISDLRTLIQDQDAALLMAIGGGFKDRYYDALAERLLTLELNNKLLLTGGEPLDVDALLGTGLSARPGRVRLTVISTRFLSDPAKADFWVAQFLVAIGRWCGKNPAARLQAVFLFDEADIYLPAQRQPATKAPMENLLKRARSAGVGLFLATQSPGDFDYKCKENIRTWLIGRVKEPRALEKLRPMLSAARGDVTGKLASQKTGEFHLIRESEVTALRSDESLIRTEQLSEDRIAELARTSR